MSVVKRIYVVTQTVGTQGMKGPLIVVVSNPPRSHSRGGARVVSMNYPDYGVGPWNPQAETYVDYLNRLNSAEQAAGGGVYAPTYTPPASPPPAPAPCPIPTCTGGARITARLCGESSGFTVWRLVKFVTTATDRSTAGRLIFKIRARHPAAADPSPATPC